MKHLILFLTVVFITTTLQAQEFDINRKFGKISKSEMEMDVYEADSSADAVILFDMGYTFFKRASRILRVDDPSSKSGFQYQFERHLRIKILTNNGFKWATKHLALYQSGIYKEEMGTVKAVSYNTDENGKIVKSKINRSDIIYEEAVNNVQMVKFTLPDIKIGTVIEIEYTIVSDYLFGLYDWQFQETIPTLYSNYRVEIPEYFIYNQHQKGYFILNRETESKSVRNELTIIEKPVGTVQESRYKYTEEYVVYCFDYTAENIPAFPTHEYLSSPANYISSINFELASYEPKYGRSQNFTTSWDAVSKELIEDYNFGDQIKNTGFLKDEVATVCAGLESDLEKISAIYNYVQNELVWNGKYRIYSESIRKALKKKSGSVADINLLLIAMLKEAGIQTYPLLLSTRAHGFISFGSPSLEAFNYVVAYAVVDDKALLLDASDKYCKLNQLPPKCLNDKGRIIISPTESTWFDLKTLDPDAKTSLTQVNIADGHLTASQSIRLEGYAHYNEIVDLQEDNDTTKYIEDIKESLNNIELINCDINNLNKESDNGKIQMELDATKTALLTDDLIAFSPMLNLGIYNNPLKQDTREYPVEMNYPILRRHTVQIKIPEGYEVESLPEQIAIGLPDDGGKFIYQISCNSNAIIISSILFINQTIFPCTQYAYLKNFYRLIVEKHSEKIVFKKSDMATL